MYSNEVVIPDNNPWDNPNDDAEIVPQCRLSMPTAEYNTYQCNTKHFVSIFYHLNSQDINWWLCSTGHLISTEKTMALNLIKCSTLFDKKSMFTYRINNVSKIIQQNILIRVLLFWHIIFPAEQCWLSYDLGLTFVGSENSRRDKIALVKIIISLDKVPIDDIDSVLCKINQILIASNTQLCIQRFRVSMCPTKSATTLMHEYKLISVRLERPYMIVIGTNASINVMKKTYMSQQYVQQQPRKQCQRQHLESVSYSEAATNNKQRQQLYQQQHHEPISYCEATANKKQRFTREYKVPRFAAAVVIGAKNSNNIEILRRKAGLSEIYVKKRRMGEVANVVMSGTNDSIKCAEQYIARMVHYQIPIDKLDADKIQIKCSKLPGSTQTIRRKMNADYVRWRRNDKTLILCFARQKLNGISKSSLYSKIKSLINTI